MAEEHVTETTEVLPSAEESALPQEELDRLTEDLIAAIKTVYDPEIPVDVYELGLIYSIDISDDRDVEIAGDGLTPGASTLAVRKRAAIPGKGVVLSTVTITCPLSETLKPRAFNSL